MTKKRSTSGTKKRTLKTAMTKYLANLVKRRSAHLKIIKEIEIEMDTTTKILRELK